MGEMCDLDWDFVLLSETRRGGQQCKLIDGHMLFPSPQNTTAAGVAVLVHSRHSQSVKRVCSVGVYASCKISA